MANKQEAIAQLDRAQQDFRGRIANLPADAYDEIFLGKWNLSHLLAHMAGWAKEMRGACERVAAGQKPTPEGVDYSNSDLWNAKFSSTATPGKQALVSWDLRFKEYMAAAQGLDASLYGEKDGRPLIGNRLLQTAGIGHLAEHQVEIDAWLAARK